MAVVDASVIADLLDPVVPADAPAPRLVRDLVAAGDDLVAPALLWLEVATVLLTGIRRGRWDGAAADAAFTLLARIPVRCADIPLDQDRAFELARRYDNWPVFDLLYVALAERLGTEFYTADDRLRARLAHLPWVRGPVAS